MAGPAAITMLVAAAHQVVTLYFVSGLGVDAVAAVSAAGNAAFIVGALGQILAIGTVALVSQSAGKKDFADISLVLTQTLALALVCAVGTAAIVHELAPLYMATLSEDESVVESGVTFLRWMAPGFAALLPMTVLSATFRGIGVISAPSMIYTFTIVMDVALAAVLIPGRGFIPSLGIEGAALASTLSYFMGLIWMLARFVRTERHIPILRRHFVPRFATWRRVFSLGLPAAAELALMFLSVSVVYLVIRDQGASAQAGFGIGFRVLQVLLLPGLALSFAAAPIAGQNFGARNAARVREVFRTTATLSSIVMVLVTIVVLLQPRILLLPFETDAASAETATVFLQLMSWTLVAQGLVYTCAFMFQALGNTVPALLSAMVRFVVFSAPAVWLSYQAGFHAEQVWYLLSASIAVQAVLSLWLLQIEFKRKLLPLAAQSNNPTATGDSLASREPPSRRHVDPTQTL